MERLRDLAAVLPAPVRGPPRGAVRTTWLVGPSVVAAAILVTLALSSRCPPPPPPPPRSDDPAALPGGRPRAAAVAGVGQMPGSAPAPLLEQPEAQVVARWRALRAGGLLRGEVVTFLDCPGEAWRKVETDPQGRVIRYVRHGLAGGVPFEAELYYAEGGALGAVRYREAHGDWRELGLPGASAGPAIPAPALDPDHASEAAAGAPPRCRF